MALDPVALDLAVLAHAGQVVGVVPYEVVVVVGVPAVAAAPATAAAALAPWGPGGACSGLSPGPQSS